MNTEMKHIYAVNDENELAKYKKFVSTIHQRLNDYIEFLESEYEVCDLPKTIVWTNTEIATTLMSHIPIPAYTNDLRIVMNPNVNEWSLIYLKQLEKIPFDDDIQACCDYYTNELSTNHVLQILGHELAHHSMLFLEDRESCDSDGIWFEEGMVEYISRKYFLTEEEYEKEYQINLKLVNIFKERYGTHSIETFGSATYEKDYAGIFFEYWRSFLAVHEIVQKHHGNVKEVFESYHQWDQSNDKRTLLEWLNAEI